MKIQQISFLLFLIIASLACIYLSYWQLNRAGEVEQLSAIIQQNKNVTVNFASISKDLLQTNNPILHRNKTVILKGKFKENYFVLDNRLHNSVVGYDIIQPFILESGDTVLIDRGWVRQKAARGVMPVVNTPKNSLSLMAELYVTKKPQIVLMKDKLNNEKIQLIQSIDFNALSAIIPKLNFKYLLRLSPKQPELLTYRSKINNTSAIKNYGYAAQWIMFALIAWVGIFILLRKFKK